VHTQQLITNPALVHAPTYNARMRELAAKYAAKEKQRFGLIDGMVLELPLSTE
jgi:hypothetical protein